MWKSKDTFNFVFLFCFVSFCFILFSFLMVKAKWYLTESTVISTAQKLLLIQCLKWTADLSFFPCTQHSDVILLRNACLDIPVRVLRPWSINGLVVNSDLSIMLYVYLAFGKLLQGSDT